MTVSSSQNYWRGGGGGRTTSISCPAKVCICFMTNKKEHQAGISSKQHFEYKDHKGGFYAPKNQNNRKIRAETKIY